MTEAAESLLDRHVAAFEVALRLDAADLAAYLPPRRGPGYLDVLIELIRVDLEWGWRRGQPKALAEYEARFPEAFAFGGHRAVLAAEEERLRRRYAAEASTHPGGRPPEPSPADDLATRVVEVLRDQKAEAAPTADPASHGDDRPEFPTPGDCLHDFRLVGELGRGAFGRVYLAHQVGLAQRPVALKVAVDLGVESHTLAQLQHTNIVPIYSVHRADGLHAVCMPYFGRTTLADVYRDLLLDKKVPNSGQALVSTWRERRTRTASNPAAPETPAAEPETPAAETAFHKMARLSYADAVLWLAARLADGLAHAHERGILHRDLKPANVLLTDDGEPMLLDFNLASDAKIDATVARVGGTLQYMSPEQIAAFSGQPREATGHGPLTPASDLYALGIILFEMLTGTPPFPSHKKQAMPDLLRLMRADRSAAAPSPRSRNAAVSPAVDAIVRRCLDPDPARRYQSARELAEDLRRQLDHRPLKHTPEPSLLERLGKFRRRHPALLSWTTAAAVVVTLGASLGLAAFWRGERVADLEAREAARGLTEDRRELEFLLTTRTAATRVEQALDRGESALARFPDGDGRLARLSDAERAQAADDLRDVYWLSAQAHLLRVNPVRPIETPADLDRAEALVAEALRRYPAGDVPVSVRLQQARVARLRGRTAEADALEQQAKAQSPQGAQDLYRLAFALAEQGRFRQALDAVSDSLDRAPTPFNAWFLRGLCCDHLGREADAAAAYTVCTALKPTVSAAFFNRGLSRARQRQFDLARKDFTEVLRLDGDHGEAYFNRALAQQATGDLAAAEADATKALALGSDATRLYLVRARIRERRGDAAGAKADLAEGLKREPTDARGWVARGLARLPADPAAALADFDAALRVEPRSFAALQNKAHVLGKYLGRTEDAVRALDEAVALYPEDVRPLAGRGVLRARLGRDADAAADAATALTLDGQPANVYQVAGIYALLSKRDPAQRDAAFRLLTQAVKAGFGGDLLAIDRDLDPLRDDARFAQVEALAARR